MAPTPTTWCATSLPSSSRMVSTTEYSHAPPSDGWRILPSTLSGLMVFAGCESGESKRRYSLHDGQTLELSRILALTTAQVLVPTPAPGRPSHNTRVRLPLFLPFPWPSRLSFSSLPTPL